MDDSTSQTSDNGQVITSRFFNGKHTSTLKRAASTPVSPQTNHNNETIKGRSVGSEQWTDDKINKELLREGSESLPTPAKTLSRIEDVSGVSGTVERRLSSTQARTSASCKLSPEQFVIKLPPTVAKASTVSVAIAQAKRDALCTPDEEGFSPSSIDVSQSDRRKASSDPSSPPPSKKVKISASDSQIRGRMASLAQKPKPRDWTRATEKPPGLDKAEADTCLTCINYGRNCKGKRLVLVNLQNGKQEIKCAPCASKTGHGGRRCYWKESAKDINTYDEARVHYGGIVNTKNSRAGRIERAQRDPNSRLALDANKTYVPPNLEGQRPGGFKPSQLRSELIEATVPPAAIPAASQTAPSSQSIVRQPHAERFQASTPTSATLPAPERLPVRFNSISMRASSPALSDHHDDDETETEIDDDDIRNAFKDVQTEVIAILRPRVGDDWTARDLYTSMFVYLEDLNADESIKDGVRRTLTALRDGAIVREWVDEE